MVKVYLSRKGLDFTEHNVSKDRDALKELVFDEMPAAMDLDVTLKVDAKWGPTWGDME